MDKKHGRRKVHDYLLLLLCKSSIWFTKKHIFKIIIYLFNTSKCAANYVISFEVYDDFIGQNILMLWRQESRPFGPGWAVHITSICSWTFRLPCPRPVFFIDGYLALAKCEKCSFGQYEIPLMDFATFSWWILAVGLAVVLVIWLLKSFV